MTRADAVIGAGLTLAFLALAIAANGLGVTSEFEPGPGFAPFWLGVFGAILSAYITVRSVRADPAPPFLAAGLTRVTVAVAGLVIAIALADTVGFFVALTAYLLLVTLVIERMRAPSGIATAVGTMLLVYLVFVVFLHVPFPKGPLGV